MNQWIIKTFNKDKAVIINLVHETGKVTTHWAIPNSENVVTLKRPKAAITLTKEGTHYTTARNIPTYYVKHTNCEPVNLQDIKKGVYTTETFEVIITNNEVQKAYNSSKKSSITDEAKIIIIFMIIGFIAIGYLFNTKLKEINNSINNPTPEPEIVEEVEEDGTYQGYN